jgi:hypothetical protein
MVRYWLNITERDTNRVVYENGFYTTEGVNDEIEDWSEELYDFEVFRISESIEEAQE